MSAINQVLMIAKAIEDEGKQPSLALIKSKLHHNLPMPELIKGLQTYKSLSNEQKQALSDMKPTIINENKPEETNSQRLIRLEEAIKQLQTDNLSLQQRIKKLEQHGNS